MTRFSSDPENGTPVPVHGTPTLRRAYRFPVTGSANPTFTLRFDFFGPLQDCGRSCALNILLI